MKKTKKLKLTTLTLRHLNTRELVRANGGLLDGDGGDPSDPSTPCSGHQTCAPGCSPQSPIKNTYAEGCMSVH